MRRRERETRHVDIGRVGVGASLSLFSDAACGERMGGEGEIRGAEREVWRGERGEAVARKTRGAAGRRPRSGGVRVRVRVEFGLFLERWGLLSFFVRHGPAWAVLLPSGWVRLSEFLSTK